MSGFNIACCGKQRFLTRFRDDSGPDLEEFLGHGMLIVIPKTDFPSDLPVISGPGFSSPLPNMGSHSDTPLNNPDSDFEDVGPVGRNSPENVHGSLLAAPPLRTSSNAIHGENVRQNSGSEFYLEIINNKKYNGIKGTVRSKSMEKFYKMLGRCIHLENNAGTNRLCFYRCAL